MQQHSDAVLFHRMDFLARRLLSVDDAHHILLNEIWAYGFDSVARI